SPQATISRASRTAPTSAYRASSTSSDTARTRTTPPIVLGAAGPGRGPPAADGPGLLEPGGLPDVEAALPQRGLHPVDVALRDALRAGLGAGRRADVQPLAGLAERVDVSRAERPQPQVLGRQVGAGLHGLELGAQPDQVGPHPLDRHGSGRAGLLLRD